ncbi:hypothetical protein ACVWXN_002575 [Bradyrhizobium sp. i1.4.4]
MRIERDDLRLEHCDEIARRMRGRRDQREAEQRGDESLQFEHCAFCFFLRVHLQAKKKQCSCPIDAGTYALTPICQAFAPHSLSSPA